MLGSVCLCCDYVTGVLYYFQELTGVLGRVCLCCDYLTVCVMLL